jgi:hypothetical protein
VFVFVFLLVAPHQYPMVAHLFLAADIGVTALSVAAAIVLGAIIPWVETKMAPTTMTVATTNEMHHSSPSTW